MYPTNPSIGTITITGSATNVTYDSNGENPVTTTADVAFTEINNSLPNGLTLTDVGTDNQTATITGTLTDFVSTDTTTSNIRIKAKANADDSRITEVNESNGVGSVSITKKSGGKPILFNARRYMGSGATKSISEFGLAPDLVWIKNREDHWHNLYDSVRGAGNVLYSNTNNLQGASSTGLTSFDTDGFSVGSEDGVNESNHAIISWGWKAEVRLVVISHHH